MGSIFCKANSSSPLNSNSVSSGVIVGESKVGKTTLKDICKQSILEFDIIDTPSLNVLKDTEIEILYKALTKNPINTIFIMIEYENRFERIVENFLKLEAIFSQFSSKIVVIISHWELSYDPEQEKKEIYQMFEGYCSRIIFFSNKNKSPEIINEMYKHMSSMSQQSIIIDDKFFLDPYFKYLSGSPITNYNNKKKSLLTIIFGFGGYIIGFLLFFCFHKKKK